jgi:hypothetical protein
LLGNVRDGQIGIVGLANFERGPGAEDADLGVGVFVPQVEEETGTGPEDAKVLIVYRRAVKFCAFELRDPIIVPPGAFGGSFLAF